MDKRGRVGKPLDQAIFSLFQRYKIVALSLSVPGGRFCYTVVRRVIRNCALAAGALFVFWGVFALLLLLLSSTLLFLPDKCLSRFGPNFPAQSSQAANFVSVSA
jgi:hypothetical protein